jgi:Protein of unknown function (DUF2971)
MLVYKYLAPERIDVLQTGRIRFTQPAAFNDPFESRPYLINDLSNDMWKRIFKIEGRRLRIAESQIKAMLARLQSSDFDNYISFGFRHLLEIMSRSVAILSVSEIPDSLLMWAHYAKSHEGFLIGFDAAHEFFGSRERDRLPNHLSQVIYTANRPDKVISETGVPRFTSRRASLKE